MKQEKKILIEYIIYILVFILICFIGITGVFADTVTDTSTFINITGRKWSTGSLEYTGSPAFNSDWLLNNYNITGGIYTPPSTWEYVEFLYFEHNNSVYNPCNSSGKFTAEFRLLFTNANFINYVSSVKWGDDSCSIQERNQDGTMKVSCIASPSSSNFTDIYVNFNEISGNDSSYLYISRNINVTCGLNTDAIINNDNANTQNIINNQNQNTQDIINSSASNTQAIIEANKKNYEKCENQEIVEKPEDAPITGKGIKTPNGNYVDGSYLLVSDYYTIMPNSTYTVKYTGATALWNNWAFCTYDENKTVISCTSYSGAKSKTITSPANANYIRATYRDDGELTISGTICTNTLKETEKSSKGILKKLKELIGYINPSSDNFFLKIAFIPSQTYMENWYSDFKTWIEGKLGFLATPITLFLDFINLYLNLDDENIIINIPEITVPNFEENVIIQAQTFNWGSLLESKPAFKNLWDLYLDFIDVFLILNFIGLCEVTYNRIFGGDTTQYEYYTTEEVYDINDETGEATNHRLKQRRTRREEVK